MKKFITWMLVIATITVFSVMSISCKEEATEEAAAGEATEEAAAGEATEEETVVAGEASESLLIGDESEVYYMNTFLSGAAYWVGCFEGMKEAAALYGVKVIYGGTPEYDINKQVTSFDQQVAQNPAGIAVSAINPDAFVAPINSALESGIQVIAFDSDAPDSDRLSFLCVDNVTAGRMAARKVIELMNDEGKIGLLERPGQLCLEQRCDGFQEVIAGSNMEIVGTADAGGDEVESATAVSNMIQASPDISVIFAPTGIEAIGAATAVKESGKDIKVIAFDSDPAVLDLVKEGLIFTALAENTYSMGYWTMVMLYHTAHGLVNPPNGWAETGGSPLPPYVDTGLNVITAENADFFYMDE